MDSSFGIFVLPLFSAAFLSSFFLKRKSPRHHRCLGDPLPPFGTNILFPNQPISRYAVGSRENFCVKDLHWNFYPFFPFFSTPSFSSFPSSKSFSHTSPFFLHPSRPFNCSLAHSDDVFPFFCGGLPLYLSLTTKFSTPLFFASTDFRIQRFIRGAPPLVFCSP